PAVVKPTCSSTGSPHGARAASTRSATSPSGPTSPTSGCRQSGTSCGSAPTAFGQTEQRAAKLRWIHDTGVEDRGERHHVSAGALRGGGAFVESGRIRDLDHPVERATTFDRCPLAIREDIGEAD